VSRRPGIWKRKGRDDWYVTIGERQVNLGPDHSQAQLEFHRLRSTPTTGRRGIAKTSELVTAFLEAVKPELALDTVRNYQWFLDRWVALVGEMRADQLKPLHITQWFALWPTWETSTRHVAVAIVKRWSRWCAHQGHMARDPLAGVKRPKLLRRRPAAKGVLEQFEAGITSTWFRSIFWFLVDTGCRPREARTLEAARIDWEASTAMVRGKRGERPIAIPSRSLDVLRGLALRWPEGPIFRTRTGKGWSEAALRSAFKDLSIKLGIKPLFFAYQLRHAFWGRAHRAGVSDLVIAKQLGHRDLKMLHQTYADVDHALMASAVERTATHHADKKIETEATPDCGKTQSKLPRQVRAARSAGPPVRGDSTATGQPPRGGKLRRAKDPKSSPLL
jgi:integrase